MPLGFQRQVLWCRGIFHLAAQSVCTVLAWLGSNIRNWRWAGNSAISWHYSHLLILSLVGDVHPWSKAQGGGGVQFKWRMPPIGLCVRTLDSHLVVPFRKIVEPLRDGALLDGGSRSLRGGREGGRKGFEVFKPGITSCSFPLYSECPWNMTACLVLLLLCLPSNYGLHALWNCRSE